MRQGATAVLPRLTRWLVAHPLCLCLPVQAALLFADLQRLPVWGDEHATLHRAAVPLDELAIPPPGSVHPPLYFVLLRAWLSITWGADTIVRARCLSALWVLLATLAIDRCWLRRLERSQRAWFLVLWTLSPALLLYGRMVRSYSLQLLLASLALYAGWRCVRRPSLPAVLAYAGVTTALLGTHYLPGVAVMSAVALVLLWQLPRDPRPVRFAALLVPPVLIGLALTALLSLFWNAVARVGGASPYRVLGSRWLETAASLGYTFVSFTFGENLRPWTVAAALALTPAVVVLIVRGVLVPPAWLVLVGPAAVVAYLGASQWVSYAFVAGRLVFLLPFYLLLLVHAAGALPRLRTLLFSALACMSIGGIEAYFAQAGALNKAYVIPFAEIGRHVRERSGASVIAVILDGHSTSLTSVTADLPAGTRTILLRDPQSLRDAVRLAEEPHFDAVVWFARSAHDTSPDGWNARVEAAFRHGFQVRRERFASYSALDHWLMRQAGWTEQPSHVIEVLEMRRISSPPW